MTRVLFVSNGHGEEAIAAQIAAQVRALSTIECDHLALVGEFGHPSIMRDVGPRRPMPSGGLIAMGNVRNIVRDLRAGLIAHTVAQWRFLGHAGGEYAAAIAVGDVFALLMALRARASKTVFVGTAKSVYVAPYGRLEERALARADAVFVRDEATASRLQSHGIAARAGNAIADIAFVGVPYGDAPGASFSPLLTLFPGSRESAYADANFLCRIVRAIAQDAPKLGAVLSIAPGLDADRFAANFEGDGWRAARSNDERKPFSLYAGDRELVRAWRGEIGAALANATLVLGQAGTANEAAAAAGVPVVAFLHRGERRHAWYRKRQEGLLGDALIVCGGNENDAVQSVRALLADPARLARMGRIGRERMGPPGAAIAIAREVVAVCAA